MTAGLKYNKGKPRMSLLSSRFLLEMGKVLTYGENKYTTTDSKGAHNWRKGIPVSELLDAVMRHLVKANEGDDVDEESGLQHLAHAAIDIMMAWETIQDKPLLDDRFKGLPAVMAMNELPQPQPKQLELPLQLAPLTPKETDFRTMLAAFDSQLAKQKTQTLKEASSAQSTSVTVVPKS